MTHYELLLREIAPNSSDTIRIPFNPPSVSLNTSYVAENVRYKYQLKLVNNIGISDETQDLEFCMYTY